MVQQCGAARRRLAVLVVGTLLLTACDPILERNSYNQKTGFVSVTGVAFDVSSATLVSGGPPVGLKVTVSPAAATDPRITWTSTRPDLVTVDGQGRLVSTSKTYWDDSAVVTVKTVDGGFTATLPVTVKSGAVSGVTLEAFAPKLNLDSPPLTLVAAITPSWAANQDVTWGSSAPAVATVSPGGVLTPRAAGSTLITVTTDDGHRTAYQNLTVVGVGAVTGLSVTPALDLVVGGDAALASGTLVPQLLPANAANKTLNWSTYDAGIVSVGPTGLVMAKNPGKATVWVTSAGDPQYSASATVTVTALYTPAKRTFPLPAGILTAAYSRSLDRLVLLSNSPPAVISVDPVTGTSASVALPHSPLSLGLSPDGQRAAVGYDQYVGTLDLSGGTPKLVDTWPLIVYTGTWVNRGAIGSIGIDNQGVLYAVDTADSSIGLRRISAGGQETLVSVPLLSGGDRLVMHPGNSSFYITSENYTMRVDINASGQAVPAPYINGGSVTKIWFYDTGAALVSARAGVYSVTQVQTTDLANIGTISGSSFLQWVEHSGNAVVGGVAGALAVIPTDSFGNTVNRVDREIRWFDTESYSLQKLALLPDFTQAGTAYPGHGRYCFWNSSGTELYALMVSAGAPNAAQWQLVAY